MERLSLCCFLTLDGFLTETPELRHLQLIDPIDTNEAARLLLNHPFPKLEVLEVLTTLRWEAVSEAVIQGRLPWLRDLTLGVISSPDYNYADHEVVDLDALARMLEHLPELKRFRLFLCEDLVGGTDTMLRDEAAARGIDLVYELHDGYY
jgi:hypothetical protein